MSSLAIRLQFEPLRSLGFASISGTYMGVGTAITNPARQIYIVNITDATLLFSFDGIHDHFALPSNGFILLDITSNKTRNEGFYLAEGDRLYVKESGVPSLGSVYFSVMYAAD